VDILPLFALLVPGQFLAFLALEFLDGQTQSHNLADIARPPFALLLVSDLVVDLDRLEYELQQSLLLEELR
jgi:hypothetical protein